MSRSSLGGRGGTRLGTIGRAAVAVIGASVILAGCSSNSSNDGEAAGSTPGSIETGMVNAQSDAGDAVSGGTLTYGVQLLAATLDPTKTAARGGSGGEALAAVYDVLMQWDSATGEFSPKLADALDANADSTVWTLKLRDGVKFSDGTPLDAAAVERMPGVLKVVRDGNFLAVVAEREWQAIKAMQALSDAATWRAGPGLPSRADLRPWPQQRTARTSAGGACAASHRATTKEPRRCPSDWPQLSRPRTSPCPMPRAGSSPCPTCAAPE